MTKFRERKNVSSDRGELQKSDSHSLIGVFVVVVVAQR